MNIGNKVGGRESCLFHSLDARSRFGESAIYSTPIKSVEQDDG